MKHSLMYPSYNVESNLTLQSSHLFDDYAQSAETVSSSSLARTAFISSRYIWISDGSSNASLKQYTNHSRSWNMKKKSILIGITISTVNGKLKILDGDRVTVRAV